MCVLANNRCWLNMKMNNVHWIDYCTWTESVYICVQHTELQANITLNPVLCNTNTNLCNSTNTEHIVQQKCLDLCWCCYISCFTLHLYLGGAGGRGDCDDILVGSLMHTTKQKDLRVDVGGFFCCQNQNTLLLHTFRSCLSDNSTEVGPTSYWINI